MERTNIKDPTQDIAIGRVMREYRAKQRKAARKKGAGSKKNEVLTKEGRR